MENKLKLIDNFMALMGDDAGSGNIFSDSQLSSYFDNRYTSSTGYRGLSAP